MLPLLAKRNVKRKGFRVESSMSSTTESMQISNMVDCTNGTDDGCPITVGLAQTKLVTTSYSLTASGGIEGIFSIETTFGIEYTESTTMCIQEGV